MTDGANLTTPEDRERYYDEQIAPRLLEIADMCRAVDMPMIAAVYFHEEYTGLTRLAPAGDHPAWWLMYHAWHARGNVDAMMMAFCPNLRTLSEGDNGEKFGSRSGPVHFNPSAWVGHQHRRRAVSAVTSASCEPLATSLK